jgi:hypothetical protein
MEIQAKADTIIGMIQVGMLIMAAASAKTEARSRFLYTNTHQVT